MVVLLAAGRVPLHDLGIVEEGSAAAWLLVFVPLAVWVGVVGSAHAVMLAVVHQVSWGAAFGGNLEGMLAPGLEAAVFRVSAFFSSLVTGTMVGAVTGAVAWTIERLRRT